VWINLGTQLAKADLLPEAVSHFEEAVRLDPESHKAHYNLARALEVFARPQDAIKHYRMALKFRPEDAATHYNLARLLEAAGTTRQAGKHYRLAIAAHPDFSAAHTNLGLLLLNSGRTQEAIAELEDALRLQEDLANYMNLIFAYSQDGRIAAAASTVERAVNLARAEGNTPLANRLEKALKQLRDQTQP
jgi:tetratricopeptide (TPR) repeat protein